MLDIKLDKFRDASGQINEKALKKAEIAKCNEYCKSGLVMFAHFTYLYSPNKERNPRHSVQFLEELPLFALVDHGCTEPDESKFASFFSYLFSALILLFLLSLSCLVAFVSEEEVRPFLNAHFLMCRIMSKVIATAAYLPPNSGNAQRAHYMVACLRRYEWLNKFAVKICGLRGLQIDEVFGEEHKICVEMTRLLPSKIDRMCFLGESGLSL